MTHTMIETAFPENSISVFRSLIAELDLSHFSAPQLHDLAAIAGESAEGLCHGLLCLSEGLASGELLPPQGILQVSAYLNASAHLLPALFELSEQAGIQLVKAQSQA